MSGIYIPHVQFPKDGWLTLRVYPTGEVARPNWQGDCTFVGKAIPVPDHGRLIEADELLEHRFIGVVGEQEKMSYMVGWNNAIEAVVENAPTIIPADFAKGMNVPTKTKEADE